MRRENVSADELTRIADAARYVGSPYHKSRPADYNFRPQTRPRPRSSLCDRHRKIMWKEAAALLRAGIKHATISNEYKRGMPKRVWAVDADGTVFEAVLGGDTTYHGYALEDSDPNMRRAVIAEWARRT